MESDTVQNTNDNNSTDPSNGHSVSEKGVEEAGVGEDAVVSTATSASDPKALELERDLQALISLLHAINPTINNSSAISTKDKFELKWKSVKITWRTMWSSDKSIGLVRWLIFSVLIALLPILLVVFSLTMHDLNVNYENTISHGELLLVSIAILGDITGDLLLNKRIHLDQFRRRTSS